MPALLPRLHQKPRWCRETTGQPQASAAGDHSSRGAPRGLGRPVPWAREGLRYGRAARAASQRRNDGLAQGLLGKVFLTRDAGAPGCCQTEVTPARPAQPGEPRRGWDGGARPQGKGPPRPAGMGAGLEPPFAPQRPEGRARVVRSLGSFPRKEKESGPAPCFPHDDS